MHNVLFIATDNCGASDTCDVTIKVFNTIPTAVAVAGLSINADTSFCEADIPAEDFDDGSFDPDGQTLTFTAEPPGPYTLGITPVLLIVSDGCQSDTANTQIEVTCPLVSAPTDNTPIHFSVAAAVPNPFRGNTQIRLSLPEARVVRAQVYDVKGRLVASLANQKMEAGEHQLDWDGRSQDGVAVRAGFYMIRVQAGQDVEIRKVVRAQ